MKQATESNSPENYAEIQRFAVNLPIEWKKVTSWVKILPKETGRHLFDWSGLKGIPGLYRLILCKPVDVTFTVIKENVNVHFMEEVTLSIGKTGDLGQRLGTEHFSSNARSGRLR